MTGITGVATEPHTTGDVLDAARGIGVAEPTLIRVRPELHDRMRREVAASSVPVTFAADGDLSHLDGIPLAIDAELPGYPGYEVHRAGPSGVARAA